MNASRSSLENICIFGNIGSGKSTLARLLGAVVPDSVTVPESFDENPFLALYIQNPPRWAFTNAVRYFYDYVRVYHEVTNGRAYAHKFIDAGIATNRYIYAPYLSTAGLMTAEETKFYNTLCDILQRHYEHPEADGYIYVASSPEACFERMRARGWTYQTDYVEKQYLVALRGHFEAFKESLLGRGTRLLELDSEKLDFTAEPGKAEAVRWVRAFLGEPE